MKTDELISEVVSLPIDLRVELADRLLKSINPSQKKIDALWAKEAEKRVEDIKSGKVKTISGKKVFKNIGERFKK